MSGLPEPWPEHRENVRTIATVLANVLRCYVVDAGASSTLLTACPQNVGGARVDTVMIEGHTDSNPIRTFKYQDNLELSSARSAEVLRMIEQDAPELTTFRNDSNKPVMSWRSSGVMSVSPSVRGLDGEGISCRDGSRATGTTTGETRRLGQPRRKPGQTQQLGKESLEMRWVYPPVVPGPRRG